MPGLTVERTIADLVDIGTDPSLVAETLRDAVRADKLVAPELLQSYLSALSARRNYEGAHLAEELVEFGGVTPGG